MLTLSVLAYLGVGPSPRSARGRGQGWAMFLAPDNFEPGPIFAQGRHLHVDQPEGEDYGPHDVVGYVARVPGRPPGPRHPERPRRHDGPGQRPYLCRQVIGAAEKGHDDIGRSCRPRDRDPRGKLSELPASRRIPEK